MFKGLAKLGAGRRHMLPEAHPHIATTIVLTAVLVPL
jgi:hypothetical protein